MWLRKMERVTLLFLKCSLKSIYEHELGDLAVCKLAHLLCSVKNKTETYLVRLGSWRSLKKVKEI